MKNSIHIKNVKCHQCHKKYKTTKHDILEIADNCPSDSCGLRSDGYNNIMSLLRSQKGLPEKEKEPTTPLEVDDPIFIEVDNRGHERTLS